MKIYIGHSSSLNYKKELYIPLEHSSLTENYELVFPHDDSEGLFDSKSFLRDECDLMIAEVSEASTGLGIELGWADSFDVKIICIYREGSNPSSSIEALDCEKLEYGNREEMVEKLVEKIN